MLDRRSLLAAPALLLLPRVAFAGTPPIYAENGIAIDGTDPTGYFTDGAPVAGDPRSRSTGMAQPGASKARNRAQCSKRLRAATPPRFGGYCAWAVAEGYTASTTPDAWKIVDDRLYLNFSRRIQRRWERDIPGNILRAEANWPAVLDA